MSKSIILMVVLCATVSTLQAIPKKEIQKVLEKLVQATGDRHVLKPNIEISEEQRVVAAYYKKRNTILIETKALAVCRSLGADSLNALAFILGHELVHATQNGAGECAASANFLAWANDTGQEKMLEHDADIGGVFLAYMAGFRTVRIVPQIIEKVYDAYQLKDQKLHRYPTMQERKATAEVVLRKIQNLIYVFDAATYLTAAGKHEEAIVLYKQILPYYRGIEVLNNVGLNYVLYALNDGPVNNIPWALPLELDASTRLNKPKVSRGDDEEFIKQAASQKKHLLQAKKFFQEAKEMDHDYYPAVLNSLTTAVLLGKADSVVSVINKSLTSRMTMYNPASEREKEILQLVKAFALAEAGKEKDAMPIWKKLALSTSDGVAWQANHNISVVQKASLTSQTSASCDFVPEVLRKQIDGIRLHAVNPAGEPTLTDVVLSYNVFIEPLPQSCLVTLYTGKKKKLTIQLVNNLHLRDDFQWKEVRNQNQGFNTRDGFILHCPEKKAAIRVNEDTHWVTQGVRYYFY